jgi:hypothetical protein
MIVCAYNYHVAFQVAVIGLYKWIYNSYNNTFTSITLRPGLLNVKRIRNDIISLEKKENIDNVYIFPPNCGSIFHVRVIYLDAQT